MVVTDFVSNVFLRSTGKLPTFASGSTKWLKIVAISNFYIDAWARERGVNWNSLYSPDLAIGSVTATDTFPLPATIRKVSDLEEDCVRILHTNGITYTNFTTIAPERLKEFDTGNYVAQIGSTLKFNRPFVSTDPQFGGSIKVPAYLFAAHIAADADVIPVDDPNWLILITAAEYIRNDVTRQNQYGNLVAEANEAMQSMKDDNNQQVTEVSRPWQPLGMTWN